MKPGQRDIWKKTVCDCTIQHTGPLKDDVYIVYCPLHAAAPEMLEALKEIAKGEAPFKIDPLEHALAGIDLYVGLATAAITRARGATL